MTGQDHASPALSLLVAAARLDLDAATQAGIERALAAGVDWRDVETLGKAHGVLPLLQRHVARGAVPCPPDVAARLHAIAARTAQRNLSLVHELRTLLDLLASIGVEAMPLKGPVLAQMAYGSVALRRMSDLDVLCDAAQLERAVSQLTRTGYRLTTPDALRAERLRVGHHVTLQTPSGFCVELHYRLFAPSYGRSIDFAAIRPLLITQPMFGLDVQMFARDELLAYLCVHGQAHLWARLEWLAAVSALIGTSWTHDWERVISFAQRLGRPTAVPIGVLTAHRLLRAPLPPNVRFSRAEHGAAEATARAFVAHAATPRGRRPLLTQLACEARWRDRARSAAWTLFLPNIADVDALRLPRAFSLLYLVLRPMRLVVRSLRRRGGGATPLLDSSRP